jgi:signal transduction histidine kinase
MAGALIYEKQRDWNCMFSSLQENRGYYNKMLDLEHTKAAVEMEKDHLRNLIGNVAHDLKTPLQAFMSELSGLRIDLDGIRQLLGSPAAQSDLPSAREDVMREKVGEMQQFLSSIEDIYQFMMMAINRAIDFRKATAGLKLLPSSETFELLPMVNWAVSKFGTNINGFVVKVQVHASCQEICPMVISDKHWFLENILCLGSNACKFTSHGEVTVRCSIVSELDIRIFGIDSHPQHDKSPAQSAVST